MYCFCNKWWDKVDDLFFWKGWLWLLIRNKDLGLFVFMTHVVLLQFQSQFRQLLYMKIRTNKQSVDVILCCKPCCSFLFVISHKIVLCIFDMLYQIFVVLLRSWHWKNVNGTNGMLKIGPVCKNVWPSSKFAHRIFYFFYILHRTTVIALYMFVVDQMVFLICD